MMEITRRTFIGGSIASAFAKPKPRPPTTTAKPSTTTTTPPTATTPPPAGVLVDHLGNPITDSSGETIVA